MVVCPSATNICFHADPVKTAGLIYHGMAREIVLKIRDNLSPVILDPVGHLNECFRNWQFNNSIHLIAKQTSFQIM